MFPDPTGLELLSEYLLPRLFWSVDCVGMGLTAQHPVISELSESPGHVTLLGISGSPNRLLLNECSSPGREVKKGIPGRQNRGGKAVGQRHSGRFSTCNDTLGRLHSLKGPGNLMGTKLDVSRLGGTLGPPPSLPQAVRHPSLWTQ